MKSFFLSREFVRAARRARLNDDALREAVDRAEAGKVDLREAAKALMKMSDRQLSELAVSRGWKEIERR